MSVILILMLASLAVALLFLAGFIWSVCSGQYEDTTTPAMRVLMDEDSPSPDSRPPLTLTLSPGEREQQAKAPFASAASRANSDSRIHPARRTMLPLPGGEGRGEGAPYKSKAALVAVPPASAETHFK